LIVAALCFIISSVNGQEINVAKNKLANINKPISTGSNFKKAQSNNPGTQTSNQLPNFNNQISDVVRTIFQDSKGNIWFGTQNGAFKLNGDSLIHIDSIKSESGKGVTIKDIAEDKDGRIWFGHSDGISSIDDTSVTNYYKSDGLISNDVWCIETDIKGNVWIGTMEGVCIFNGQGFTKFALPEGRKDTTVGISSTKMIHSILEDSMGTIWLCTNAGLFSYTNKELKNISAELGILNNFISKIIEDKKGGFWISTSMGLLHLHGNSLTNISELHFKESKGTGSIIVDSEDNVWFTCSRSIYRLNGEKLSEYRITEGNYGPLTFQIYEDKESRLWFVGYGGAYRYENGRFINIKRNGPWKKKETHSEALKQFEQTINNIVIILNPTFISHLKSDRILLDKNKKTNFILNIFGQAEGFLISKQNIEIPLVAKLTGQIKLTDRYQ